MDKTVLGQRIRDARKHKGLTQEDLAEKAGIGTMYIGEIERGQKMPSLNTFCQIVEALDVSADYLLRDSIQAGKDYVINEITEKLEAITPQQRKTIIDIVDAYLKNI